MQCTDDFLSLPTLVVQLWDLWKISKQAEPRKCSIIGVVKRIILVVNDLILASNHTFLQEVKKRKALKFCFCRPESLSWSESTDMTLWSWTQRIMQKFNMIQRWFHALRSNANAGSMLFARTQSIHDNSVYRFSLLQRWVNSYNTCSKTDGNDMLTLGSAHHCRSTEGSRTKDTIYWRASDRTVFLAWWLCLDSDTGVSNSSLSWGMHIYADLCIITGESEHQLADAAPIFQTLNSSHMITWVAEKTIHDYLHK